MPRFGSDADIVRLLELIQRSQERSEALFEQILQELIRRAPPDAP